MLPKVTLVAVVNGLIGEPTGTVTPRVTGMKRVKLSFRATSKSPNRSNVWLGAISLFRLTDSAFCCCSSSSVLNRERS